MSTKIMNNLLNEKLIPLENVKITAFDPSIAPETIFDIVRLTIHFLHEDQGDKYIIEALNSLKIEEGYDTENDPIYTSFRLAVSQLTNQSYASTVKFMLDDIISNLASMRQERLKLDWQSKEYEIKIQEFLSQYLDNIISFGDEKLTFKQGIAIDLCQYAYCDKVISTKHHNNKYCCTRHRQLQQTLKERWLRYSTFHPDSLYEDWLFSIDAVKHQHDI